MSPNYAAGSSGRLGQAGAQPGGLAEPEAALSCPCTDPRGLELLPLKKKDSNGDLSKEDLAWPLDLAPVQKVSEHRGCFLGAVCGGHLVPGSSSLSLWASLALSARGAVQ